MADRNHISIISNNDEGQTLVEFALVAMLLVAILFGIAEFGRAWFYSNHLTNSVRAAARYGAVLGTGYSDAAVRQYLVDEISASMNPDNINNAGTMAQLVDVDGNGVPSRGDVVEVTGAYDFDFLVGSYIVENIFNQTGTVTMTRTASMQFEGMN